MCGIAGFVGAGDRSDLERMTGLLAHRGPDGSGYHIAPAAGVHLGHRRLAVVDLVGGQQPMWNEDNTICVIFNGEIYNHHELRELLVAKGHRFRSDHSDTEVLVHGHEEWGDELALRLNGMFAYTIFDSRTGRLHLARDRFGEKPLYWALLNDAFVFGSELPSLLAHPSLAGASIDPVSAQKFFGYGFIPAPRTIYRRVHKLAHGATLTFDPRTWSVDERRYWTFGIIPDPPAGTTQDWIETIRGLLSSAVARRLESDVPLGIFLSGGIDSSTILSFAADHIQPSLIRTFSIGFKEASFDESEFARTVAMHVGSDHSLEMCELQHAKGTLPSLLQKVGEPCADPSILPTYLLSAFTRKHVTVALSGDGGDELFAGYDPFKILGRARLYASLVPRPVHQALQVAVARIPASDKNMSLEFKLKRGLRGLGHDPALWNASWLGPLDSRDIAELFQTPVSPESLYGEAIDAWDKSSSPGIVDRTLEFYSNFYLPENILLKSDRSSMLNSLEVRSPFLDNDLVEFARRLPASVKLKNGTTKWILKEAVRQRLPRDILKRRKKGFGIPLARWLRELQPPSAAKPLSFLNEDFLRKAWADHKERRGDHRAALLCWLSLRALSDPLETPPNM